MESDNHPTLVAASTKDSILDNLVYVLFCVATLGTAWMFRVVITVAIQKAIR